MTFNGNGEYTLREDGAGTHFCSEASEGKQTVRIKASEGSIPRKITLEMRNIKNGKVTVYANGALIPADVRGDEYTTVTLENVLPNVEYTVVAEYMPDARAYRDARYLEALTHIEVDNIYKKKLWELHEIESDKELLRAIMADEVLTENEKIRLTEAW